MAANKAQVIETASDRFVIERVVGAPRDLVWEAWTSPEHFAQWFGPRETVVTVLEMDARPGGILRFRHHHADGIDVWAKCVYDEVVKPKRLAFTVYFTDETGEVVDRPGFPQGSRVTATFDESEGKTRVTVRYTGMIEDQGESDGMMETLDRLAEHLSGAVA